MPEAKVTFLLNNLRIAYVLCYQPNHTSLYTKIWLIHRLYMPALILYVYFNIRSGFSIHVSMQVAPIILRAVYIKHTYIRKKYVSCFLGFGKVKGQTNRKTIQVIKHSTKDSSYDNLHILNTICRSFFGRGGKEILNLLVKTPPPQ